MGDFYDEGQAEIELELARGLRELARLETIGDYDNYFYLCVKRDFNKRIQKVFLVPFCKASRPPNRSSPTPFGFTSRRGGGFVLAVCNDHRPR